MADQKTVHVDPTGKEAPAVIEGALIVPKGARFALVVSRFNHFIVDRLVEGALDAITRHGGSLTRVTIIRVPGSWEIPPVVGRIARRRSADGIIALGAVIRGQTPHFDYIAAEVSKGVAHVALETSVPIAFGILTTDTIEQAIERAGTKNGNKGWDAAMSAIEMVSLTQALDVVGL
jgi:6,7-dimethyl-8-ribityllumazine synthase